jgi:type IV pilus assembly protein PilX
MTTIHGRRLYRIWPRPGVHRQHGFTLILVLIFIASLSLIAAVAMRNVNIGERVVANERDRYIAFQGAESSGREAIALIKAGNAAALAKGYYALPLRQGGNADFWRTTSSRSVDSSVCASTDTAKRFDWAGCSAFAASAYENSTPPQYVIELLSVVVKNPTTTETWYRITTRASGGSSESDVILQILYTPP